MGGSEVAEMEAHEAFGRPPTQLPADGKPAPNKLNATQIGVDAAGYPIYIDSRGARLCGAKRADGGWCHCIAIKDGNGRCKFHGGRVKRGVENPTFKHGKYSEYLDKGVRERYNQLRSDKKILHMREEIALIDLRITELLKRVDTAESSTLWHKAREAFKSLKIGQTTGDAVAIASAIANLEEAIGRGVSDAFLWAEIGSQIELRRRCAETEFRRLTALRATVSIDSVMTIMNAVAQVVRENVRDSETVTIISGELRRLLGSGESSVPDAGEAVPERISG